METHLREEKKQKEGDELIGISIYYGYDDRLPISPQEWLQCELVVFASLIWFSSAHSLLDHCMHLAGSMIYLQCVD